MAENIYKKLSNVQAELKAPKSNTNSFGNYKYRSAEDILEAVKPLLAANGLVMILSDEVVAVGSHNYVKATATLIDVLDISKVIITTALAREPEAKKGMDDSQITGAASSYARKYALNGMFNIDDTKDADSMDNTKYKPAAKPDKLSLTDKERVDNAKRDLIKEMKEVGYDTTAAQMAFVKSTLGKDVIETLNDCYTLGDAIDNERQA